MPKPKNATAYVEGVSFTCNGCRDSLPEPFSGSHLWSIEDARMRGGNIVHCTCGTQNIIPATLRPRVA